MGYQSAHRGSPRGSGQKFQKSQHEKAKTRAHRHRAKGAFSEEENSDTAEIVVEKVVNNLKRLGEQKFAVSPFRQYFDDWLLNVKQAVSEFESSPAVIVDEEFVKERKQTLTKIEAELVKTKREEETLEPCVKELADTNHLLVKIDSDYAAKTRETATRRNSESQRLTKNVQNLEAELERVKAIKTSFIGGVSKKAKAQKIDEASMKLEAAKVRLEKAIESFKVEQEKLHDCYEKSKQTAMAKVQMLEKEIEKLETDESLNARHEASEGLAKAVNALLARQPKPSNGSTG
jgi:hypothetical protein